LAEFKDFKKAMKSHLDAIIKDNDRLFVANVSKEQLWDTYLQSFPEGTNVIHKERCEYDCNCCKTFIRKIGNVVAIKDNKPISIWDIEDLSHPYNAVAKALSKLVKRAIIRDIFVSSEANLGADKTRQLLEDGSVHVWEHFHTKLPKKFIKKPAEISGIMSNFRDSKNVFKRSMEELTIDAGQTILELIDQGSLYRGEEYKSNIYAFIKAKDEYDKVPKGQKDNWCWLISASSPIARIRNTALGTLLIDLSAGVELDNAVTKFEKVMAPTNYKRPKAIFTKRMVEEAEKKIQELGYLDSLGRRFATIDDINVNNVLFVDRDVKNRGQSVFEGLKDDAGVNPRSFSRVEEVNMDDFVNKIIPKSKNIELMLESKHQGNMMSLIAPINKGAPSMLKWSNNFGWSYNGDITDSMKQRVKNAGGNVDGVLRFSIQWNDQVDNKNDFDAHCVEPNRNHIYYPSHGKCHPSSGMLDVDITDPITNVAAVENIVWTDINKMKEGKYKFYVRNYSHNGGTSGFSAEIEYDGQIYTYNYDKELRHKEDVVVAEIEFSKTDGIKFIKSLDSKASSREIWGVKTNTFHKVLSLMFSPNYWDGQKGIGNKHYFFFLEKCKSDSLPRGFYNEFLKEDLLTHKRVFEALGSKMRVNESDKQLSGIGFSSTQHNDIIAKVDGNFSRTIKIVV